jgi:CubicO group peptidase (beta-lactamase class C family)
VLLIGIGVAVSSAAQAQPVSKARLAATEALVARSVDELVKVPGGIAGYSVVIAADGAPDFVLTRGLANARNQVAVTPDTAFYIASMTKSYTGLLAARLHREAVLPLDTTLDDIWPGLRLPAQIEPGKVTLRQLLSHRGGFDSAALEERTAYFDEVPAEAYPRLLETTSTAGKQGFEYSNSGYLIYSAALKERTGRDWKAWLSTDVFAPLALTQTYSRSSLIPPADLAWGHQWDGRQWVPVVPKSDEIMHAAGGLFASSRDLAKWIRWQLNAGKGQNALTSADFEATRVDLAGGGLGEGGFGITCTGYALGWSLCTFQGVDLLYHGGTYTGVRTHLFILPRQRVGVAILANSDGMTGGLGQAFMSVIAASLLGRPDAKDHAAQMITGYAERVAKQIENRRSESAASEADARWAGWAWNPDPAALSAYQGVYHSDAFGDLEVRLEGAHLIATLGATRRQLRPAAPALFGARATPVERWEAVRFSGSKPGHITNVDFLGKSFNRAAVK